MLNNCSIKEQIISVEIDTTNISNNYWKWSRTHLHALSLNIIERCKASLKPNENLNVNLKIKNRRNHKQGITKNCNASTLEKHFLNLIGVNKYVKPITRQTRNMQTLTQHQKEHVKNWMQHNFLKGTHSLAPLVSSCMGIPTSVMSNFPIKFSPKKLAKIGTTKEERLKPWN